MSEEQPDRLVVMQQMLERMTTVCADVEELKRSAPRKGRMHSVLMVVILARYKVTRCRAPFICQRMTM